MEKLLGIFFLIVLALFMVPVIFGNVSLTIFGIYIALGLAILGVTLIAV